MKLDEKERRQVDATAVHDYVHVNASLKYSGIVEPTQSFSLPSHLVPAVALSPNSLRFLSRHTAISFHPFFSSFFFPRCHPSIFSLCIPSYVSLCLPSLSFFPATRSGRRLIIILFLSSLLSFAPLLPLLISHASLSTVTAWFYCCCLALTLFRAKIFAAPTASEDRVRRRCWEGIERAASSHSSSLALGVLVLTMCTEC